MYLLLFIYKISLCYNTQLQIHLVRSHFPISLSHLTSAMHFVPLTKLHMFAASSMVIEMSFFSNYSLLFVPSMVKKSVVRGCRCHRTQRTEPSVPGKLLSCCMATARPLVQIPHSASFLSRPPFTLSDSGMDRD